MLLNECQPFSELYNNFVISVQPPSDPLLFYMIYNRDQNQFMYYTTNYSTIITILLVLS